MRYYGRYSNVARARRKSSPPATPVVWHSFELRPFDFFDRKPALDLPKR